MDSYEEKLLGRAETLQRSVIEIEERTKKTTADVERTRTQMGRQLQELGKELLELQDETSAAAANVTRLVGRFHDVVKQGDMQKLISQVNAWAPEKKISRDVFYRMMELS